MMSFTAPNTRVLFKQITFTLSKFFPMISPIVTKVLKIDLYCTKRAVHINTSISCLDMVLIHYNIGTFNIYWSKI